MAFIGWLLCLMASVGGLFVVYIIVASSCWNGKVDKIPLLLVLLVDVALWYLTVNHAPFSVALN